MPSHPNYYKHPPKHRDWNGIEPILRSFSRRMCGKPVYVVEQSDKRTHFCCPQFRSRCRRNSRRTNRSMNRIFRNSLKV